MRIRRRDLQRGAVAQPALSTKSVGSIYAMAAADRGVRDLRLTWDDIGVLALRSIEFYALIGAGVVLLTSVAVLSADP
jgi:hypothetical protein